MQQPTVVTSRLCALVQTDYFWLSPTNSNIVLKLWRSWALSSTTSSFAKPCISRNYCLYFWCDAEKRWATYSIKLRILSMIMVYEDKFRNQQRKKPLGYLMVYFIWLKNKATNQLEILRLLKLQFFFKYRLPADAVVIFIRIWSQALLISRIISITSSLGCGLYFVDLPQKFVIEPTKLSSFLNITTYRP